MTTTAMIPDAPPIDISGLRVLVVHESSFHGWAIGNLLRDLGANAVFLSGTGAVATALLAVLEPPVDVVIVHVEMSRRDVAQLVRQMARAQKRPSLLGVSSLDGAFAPALAAMAREHGVCYLGTICTPLTGGKLRDLLAAA